MPREPEPRRRRRRTIQLPRVYDLVARGLIALVFLGSGARRMMDPDAPVEALAGAGLPAPEILNAVTAALDLAGGACLLLGVRVWVVAMALTFYVIPFAFVLHALPGKENAYQGLLFARELAIAGGLVLLAGVHRDDPRGGAEHEAARQDQAAAERSAPRLSRAVTTPSTADPFSLRDDPRSDAG